MKRRQTLPISDVKARLPELVAGVMMRQVRAGERYFAKGGAGRSFEQVFGEPLRRPKGHARRR